MACAIDPCSTYIYSLLIANIYKVLTLCTGFAFAYLGYRLYILGVFEKAQHVEAKFSTAHLLMKIHVPKTLFPI